MLEIQQCMFKELARKFLNAKVILVNRPIFRVVTICWFF
jgi:hypothetical protein